MKKENLSLIFNFLIYFILYFLILYTFTACAVNLYRQSIETTKQAEQVQEMTRDTIKEIIREVRSYDE